MTLSGRCAVVTGGTRGIGRSIAERLRAEGASVYVSGTEIAGIPPEGCSYFAADFASLDAIERAASLIAEIQPDILVNNAGINVVRPFEEIPADEFARIQQINVHAPFRLCQSAVPGMRKKGWGRIVNLSSVWGKIGKELRASYSASKFGVAGLSAALAAEVASFGIMVNCVSPGPIDTEMTRRNLTPAMLGALLRTVPAGRLGRPEEVAALVAWLAGPENTFVTGQNIAIDGGMTRV